MVGDNPNEFNKNWRWTYFMCLANRTELCPTLYNTKMDAMKAALEAVQFNQASEGPKFTHVVIDSVLVPDHGTTLPIEGLAILVQQDAAAKN